MTEPKMEDLVQGTPAGAFSEANPLASIENGDQATRSASQAAARTGTPARTTAAAATADAGSRATSAHPEANVGYPMPNEPVPNGHPTRKYINAKITPVLLEGMKLIAVEQPDDPLRALGEYLLEMSKKYEGNGSGSGSGTAATA